VFRFAEATRGDRLGSEGAAEPEVGEGVFRQASGASMAMTRSRISRRSRASVWLAELAAMAWILGAPSLVVAQGSEPGIKAPGPQQQQPVPLPSAPAEKVDPPAADTSTPGVLKPPPTGDEEAVKMPPDAGKARTPVIVPPGLPGGDPKARPEQR